MSAGDGWRPRLASRARLKFDAVAKQEMLLFPEAALLLNETGAAIVRLCDGARSIDQIIDDLASQFGGADRDALRVEVRQFLEAIRARGLLQ
jgi:pyrroloquinoline quinone biosynthesis protein D